MRTLLFLLTLVLTSCGYNETWERLQEEDRQLRTRNIASVQNDIEYAYGTIRPKTFYYNGPVSGQQPAYDYIRTLGGTLTDRRSAFFELRVTQNISKRGGDWCEGQIIAAVIDTQPPEGRFEVIAQGSIERTWAFCKRPPERAVFEALSQVS